MAREDNLKSIRTTEQARALGSKGGKASVKAKKERKQLRQMLMAELDKAAGADGMTREEYLVAKCLQNYTKGKLTFRDLKDLQDLLGESQTNINVSGDGVNIIVESKERADKIRNIKNLDA